MTFRYFTRSEKIGQFELASWSFIWGMVVFLVTASIYQYIGKNFSLDSPASLYATATTSSICLSIPIGFIGAWFMQRKLVQKIKQGLFHGVEKNNKIFVFIFIIYLLYILINLFQIFK